MKGQKSQESRTTGKKYPPDKLIPKLTPINTQFPSKSTEEDNVIMDDDDDELLVVETCSTSSSSFSPSLSPTPSSLSPTPVLPTSMPTNTGGVQEEGIKHLMHHINSRRQNRRATRTTSIRSSADPFPLRLYNKLVKVSKFFWWNLFLRLELQGSFSHFKIQNERRFQIFCYIL